MEPPKAKLPALVQKQAERLIPGGPVGRAAANALQKAIANPEIQRRVRDESTKLVRKAQEWQAERRGDGADGGADGVIDGLVDKVTSVTSRFGQDGLARRLARVRESVTIVEGAGPAAGAAEALAELRGECDRLGTALEITGRLPLVKRKRAQYLIDRRLSELEDGLLRHALE
jgi:hypothetical protein